MKMKTHRRILLSSIAALSFLCFLSCQKQEDTSGNQDQEMPPQILADKTNGCFYRGTKIVGGQAVSKNDLLSKSVFQVHSLSNKNKDDGYSKCTAVLVSNDTLITAAHCVNQGPMKSSVIFNISTWCSDGMNRDLLIPVKKIIYHEKFNGVDTGPGPNNDIALILLTRNAPHFAMPLSLADFSDVESSFEAYQIGYGKTSTSDEDKVSRLRSVQRSKSELVFNDSAFQISIEQSPQAGACKGDSGGPLLIKNGPQMKILGIASFLDPKGKGSKDHICENSTAQYLNLLYYSKWIKNNLKKIKSDD